MVAKPDDICGLIKEGQGSMYDALDTMRKLKGEYPAEEIIQTLKDLISSAYEENDNIRRKQWEKAASSLGVWKQLVDDGVELDAKSIEAIVRISDRCHQNLLHLGARLVTGRLSFSNAFNDIGALWKNPFNKAVDVLDKYIQKKSLDKFYESAFQNIEDPVERRPYGYLPSSNFRRDYERGLRDVVMALVDKGSIDIAHDDHVLIRKHAFDLSIFYGPANNTATWRESLASSVFLGKSADNSIDTSKTLLGRLVGSIDEKTVQDKLTVSLSERFEVAESALLDSLGKSIAPADYADRMTLDLLERRQVYMEKWQSELGCSKSDDPRLKSADQAILYSAAKMG